MGWTGTRREMLKLAGGSALGLMFTPVPWKLLGDSAVWTQNWPAIAKLPHGDITFRQTACALCRQGCALRARCVSGQPVGLSGVRSDPASGGALCPMGLASHQLPWHPARMRTPRRRDARDASTAWTEITPGAAILLAAGALNGREPGQLTMILDDRPGRAASDVYRAFAAAVPGGVYVPSPARDERPLETLAALHQGLPAGRLTLHPAEARAILSFGAPVLDGFGGAGTTAAWLKARRGAGVPWIIAAEPGLSRTASLSDLWLPIRPGTEAVVALGIAHVLLRDHLVDGRVRDLAIDFDAYRNLAARFTPETVGARAGVDAQAIERAARNLAAGPSLVVGGDPSVGPDSRETEIAVWGLNLLLSAGRTDGVVRFAGVMPFAADRAVADRELDQVPDGSVRLLVLDATDLGGGLAPAAVERKLAPGGLVVSLSPWPLGVAELAGVIVPAPASFETLEELPGPGLAGPARYRLAPPLLEPPRDSLRPIDFVRQLAIVLGRSIEGDAGTAAPVDLMKRRVAALHRAGRGRIVRLPEGDAVPVTAVASAEEMWDVLFSGGVWTDDDAPLPTSRFRLLGSSPERTAAALDAALDPEEEASRTGGYPLVAVASGWSGSRGAGAATPLLTKLRQESGLRETGADIVVNPVTARSLGLAAGQAVRVRTETGSATGRLVLRAGMKPGVVSLPAGPDSPRLGGASVADAAGLLRSGDPTHSGAVAARIEEA